MIIKELNIIEFGCLKSKKITLDDSLNIICGENESGKSTIMLFIKYMLFGFPRKTQTNFEREKGISRDGHRAEGTMTVIWKSELYRIERSSVMGARQLSEKKKIIRLSDGEEQFKGSEPYEIFLGVPGEVFDSSCFVGQIKCSDINGEKTSGAIENMLLSADENIDVSAAVSKLDKLRVTFRHKSGTGGSLPKLSEEISEERARLAKATENHLRFCELQARTEENRAVYEKTKAEVSDADRLIGQIKDANALRDFEKLHAETDQIDALERKKKELVRQNTRNHITPTLNHAQEIKRAYDNLEESLYALDTAKSKYEEKKRVAPYDSKLSSLYDNIEQSGGAERILSDLERIDKKRSSRKISASLFAALSLLGGGGLIAFGFLSKALFKILLPSGIGAFALFAIISVCLFVSCRKLSKNKLLICREFGTTPKEIHSLFASCTSEKAKKDIYESELRLSFELYSAAESGYISKKNALDTALKAIGITPSPTPHLQAEEEYLRITEFSQRLDEADKEILIHKTKLSEIEQRLEGYSEEELSEKVSEDFLSPDAYDLQSLLRTRSYNAQRLSVLEKNHIDSINKIATLKAEGADPLEISDRIAGLEKRYKEDNEFFSALTLAIEELGKAGEDMRVGVAPVIGKRASDMMSIVSGGKYQKLYTSKSLELSIEDEKLGISTDAKLLSGGTKDTAYLCLRIALMLQLFENDTPPILLDEALSQLDDSRAERTMHLLGELSRDTLQCIMFTCHSREKNICKDNNISANIIEL